MTQDYRDLDALVGRLRRVAAQLDNQQDVTAPPPPEQHQALQSLSIDDPALLGGPVNPARPAWHELMAADLSDEDFIRQAYATLMGREPDSAGMQHYGRLLPRAGRLYALASMLTGDEARDAMRRRGVRVRGQRYATLPLRGAGRMKSAGRVATPLLKNIYRAVAIVVRPAFRRRAQLSRQMSILLETRRQFTDVIEDMDDLHKQQLAQTEAVMSERLEEQESRNQALHQRLDEFADGTVPALFSALHQHRRAVETLMEPVTSVSSPNAQQAERWQQERLDAWYLAFEDACRGSEEQIFNHLRQYQPQLEQARAIGTAALDLGCGRGEWLRLLTEYGFEPQGIDLNSAMVDHCQALALPVTRQDAISALNERDEDSLALVSAFHLAEHLPFEILYELVAEAHRTLGPGGVLILETPNPENVLVGSHTFYHDPTHRNPLTPTAMTFMLRYHGFADVEVRRFNPYPEEARVPGNDPLTERVNGHLCGPQDFAVVGIKAAPPADTIAEQAATVAERHTAVPIGADKDGKGENPS